MTGKKHYCGVGVQYYRDSGSRGPNDGAWLTHVSKDARFIAPDGSLVDKSSKYGLQVGDEVIGLSNGRSDQWREYYDTRHGKNESKFRGGPESEVTLHIIREGKAIQIKAIRGSFMQMPDGKLEKDPEYRGKECRQGMATLDLESIGQLASPLQGLPINNHANAIV